jgi:hypothetical protein
MAACFAGGTDFQCKEYLDFILDQLSMLEEISYKAMMGEYILYYVESEWAYRFY